MGTYDPYLLADDVMESFDQWVSDACDRPLRFLELASTPQDYDKCLDFLNRHYLALQGLRGDA